MAISDAAPLPPTTMLYDADCSICTATAAWLARRVPPSKLAVLALQEAGADPRIAELTRGRRLEATLHVVQPHGSILTGARAVLAAGRLVQRWRVLALLADHRVGHWLLEPVYRFVATHRRAIGRLLGLPATCPMPTAAERPSRP
jgi:predicted DCC family thiol-disulfide oxidoreductase YuxK